MWRPWAAMAAWVLPWCRRPSACTGWMGAASMPASRVDAAPQDAGNIPLPDLPPTLLDPSDDVGPLVW